MNNLKKTALAIFAFASNAVWAGTMGPVCIEGNVTLPCAHTSWDLGVQALYLKPAYTNDSLVFGAPTTANVVNWRNADSDWAWGFKLEGSYHFRTGNDVNVNWYHFNHTTNDTVVTLNQTPLRVSLSTSTNPKWDAINGEVGQLVKFGEFNKIRFHGGAQYVQISRTFSDNVLGLLPEQIYNRFNGFGPRFGADMAYGLVNGLAVYANGAAAVLVGENKFSTTTAGVIDIPGGSYASSTAVIPELEGKLGAKYTYALTEGDLSLDIGYMWLNYINAQSFLTIQANGGMSDFALNGPYVGLKWLGSV